MTASMLSSGVGRCCSRLHRYYAAVRLLQPSGPASAPRLPEPTRDRLGGCGGLEVSQVPTRSLTARTGLRPRWSASQNGPAHVACGGSQRLGLHGKSLRGSIQSSSSRCVRFAVTDDPATLATGRALPPSRSTGWIAPASPGAHKQLLSLTTAPPGSWLALSGLEC